MISPACGQHLDPDHQDDEQLAAREAELRERDRGEEREHHRERDGDADDDQAVLDGVPEVRAGRIASRKCDSVGWSGNQVGVRLLISSSGLNAVETIQ